MNYTNTSICSAMLELLNAPGNTRYYDTDGLLKLHTLYSNFETLRNSSSNILVSIESALISDDCDDSDTLKRFSRTPLYQYPENPYAFKKPVAIDMNATHSAFYLLTTMGIITIKHKQVQRVMILNKCDEPYTSFTLVVYFLTGDRIRLHFNYNGIGPSYEEVVEDHF